MSPTSNFLAVDLFSKSRGLPHIPSHFVWSPAVRRDWQGSTWFADYSSSGHHQRIWGTSANEKLSTSGLQVSSG